jgi:hypothetical protein
MTLYQVTVPMSRVITCALLSSLIEGKQNHGDGVNPTRNFATSGQLLQKLKDDQIRACARTHTHTHTAWEHQRLNLSLKKGGNYYYYYYWFAEWNTVTALISRGMGCVEHVASMGEMAWTKLQGITGFPRWKKPEAHLAENECEMRNWFNCHRIEKSDRLLWKR